VIRRPKPAELRAALWAVRAHRSVRRQLSRRPLDRVVLSHPRRIPARGRAGAIAVLARLRSTCLTRALVVQAWDAAHDASRDLVIGVTSPGEGFAAHAWLEGDRAVAGRDYAELLRLPARSCVDGSTSPLALEATSR
jgi:hypothetical protein